MVFHSKKPNTVLLLLGIKKAALSGRTVVCSRFVPAPCDIRTGVEEKEPDA